jgi:hypothetical protein
MTVTTRRGPAQTGTAEPLSRADRAARGKEARTAAPLESHAEFRPGVARDPVGLLLRQAESRVPEIGRLHGEPADGHADRTAWQGCVLVRIEVLSSKRSHHHPARRRGDASVPVSPLCVRLTS